MIAKPNGHISTIFVRFSQVTLLNWTKRTFSLLMPTFLATLTLSYHVAANVLKQLRTGSYPGLYSVAPLLHTPQLIRYVP